MKKQLFIISFVLLIAHPNRSFAETGCLVPNYPGLLTYQSVPGGVYSEQGMVLPPSGCWWVLKERISGCIGYGKPGLKAEYELECPIDDYIPILLIFTIGFGFFKLSRKVICTQSK